MSNMDDFNRCAAEVLGMLYEAFPIRIELNCRTLAKDETNSPNNDAYCAAIEFLLDEGFIRCDMAHFKAGMFEYCRLTSKGLTALSTVPAAISGDRQPSYGDKLKDAAIFSGKQSVNALIAQIIAAFVRAGGY